MAQGSIPGPVYKMIFSMLLNTVSCTTSKLYNYADDNFTVSAADRVLSKLVANLAEDSLILI